MWLQVSWCRTLTDTYALCSCCNGSPASGMLQNAVAGTKRRVPVSECNGRGGDGGRGGGWYNGCNVACVLSVATVLLTAAGFVFCNFVSWCRRILRRAQSLHDRWVGSRGIACASAQAWCALTAMRRPTLPFSDMYLSVLDRSDDQSVLLLTHRDAIQMLVWVTDCGRTAACHRMTCTNGVWMSACLPVQCLNGTGRLHYNGQVSCSELRLRSTPCSVRP